MLPCVSSHKLLALLTLAQEYRRRSTLYVAGYRTSIERTGRFSFRSLQQLRNKLDFLFEVHTQVVLYKDAEPKVTKNILSFEPHKISEEIYLAYTRTDHSFRQLGRYVRCLPALAIIV